MAHSVDLLGGWISFGGKGCLAGRTEEEKLEDVWGVVWEVGFGRVLLGGGL